MTNLVFGTDARAKVFNGIEKGAMAVICTLGPAGRNAAIRRNPIERDGKTTYIPPLITKDGVTVADNIHSFDDPWEDIGLQMLKEAARNTNKTGDGTTTATLLAYEMIKGGMKLLNDGANAIHVRRGMEKACEAVCEKLKSMAKPVDTIEELTSIARISSQDDELAIVVASAVKEVGKEGAITMQTGISPKTEYEVVNGMQIPTGFASHYFAKNGNAELRDPFIIVTSDKIASIRDIGGILTSIREQMDQNPETKEQPIRLAIFSTGVSGDALQTLAKNNIENPDQIQCIVFNPPHFGDRQKETLEDIAIATGAVMIDKTAGRRVQDMKISDLGTCATILATSRNTTIVGSHGKPDDIQARVQSIQSRMEGAENDEKDYLNSRLAGLNGKIANIFVGGSSQLEQREKLHRVEDAIAATKAAADSGVLPGGGVALLRCLMDTDMTGNERDGFSIVMNALDKQMWWVVKNAGEDPEKIIGKVKGMKETEGFNAETREFGDMITMKVVDPAKVPIAAMKNAVSVAGMFLTIEVSIQN